MELQLSIIIPFRNHIELINENLKSMVQFVDFNFDELEILLVDNGSEESQLQALQIPEVLKNKTRIMRLDIPFNFQTLNNEGAKVSQGEVLLLLNNDIVFDRNSRELFKKLIEAARRPEVGAVGPLLYYPDGTIQHAGVVVGMGGGYADHLYRGWSLEQASKFPFSHPCADRYVSAVTAACLAVEKKKFNSISGMNSDFIVCGGDVDLCLRLSEKGYSSVYLGSTSAIHHESKSRDPSKIPAVDFTESQKSYGHFLKLHGGRDPFYPEPLPLDLNAALKSQTSHFPTFTYRVKRKLKQWITNLKSRRTHMSNEDFIAFYIARVIKYFVFKRHRKEKSQLASHHGLSHMAPILWNKEVAFETFSQKKRLNVLLPHLAKEGIFGGIITACLVPLKLLEKFPEMQLRFVLVDGPGTREVLEKYLSSYFQNDKLKQMNFEIVEAFDRKSSPQVSFHQFDFILATAWWSAFSAREIAGNKPFFYLIQDYEPGFYPWGDAFANSHATYNMNILPVFNSKLLCDYFLQKNFISKEHEDSYTWFEPAVAKYELKPREPFSQKPEKTIFLYGRRSVDRNLFITATLGIQNALNHQDFKKYNWRIVSAGEAHPPIVLNSRDSIVSVGKLSLAEYGALLSQIDIGVSLMLSPHPSYPPLELASSGALVVTNRFENKDLRAYHSNFETCEPTADDVANAMLRCLKRLENPSNLESEKFDKLSYSWDATLEPALNWIWKRMENM